MSKLCLARDFAYARPSRDDTVRRHEIGSMKRSPGPLTLIELMVVMIIAILAGSAFPVFSSVPERARIREDLSNLRRLVIATQTYLDDNDSIPFLSDQTVTSWMKSLHPKYLPAWKILQSPFDGRSPLEDGSHSPVSYGLNGNSAAGISTGKIVRPSAFILMALVQRAGTSVAFTGTAATTAVTVCKAP